MILADALFLCTSSILLQLLDFGNGLISGKELFWADEQDVEWMASLRSVADEKKHICGCTVYLNNRWIITARSCLLDEVGGKAQSVVVYPMYSVNLEEMAKENGYYMEKSFCHPLLKNKPDIHTDIGLVKLQKPIEPREGVYYQSARVLREDFEYKDPVDSTFVAGWGRRSESLLNTSNFLSRAFFGFKDPIVCQRDPKSIDFVSPNHICMRHTIDPKVVPCFGDDGGPALYRGASFYYDLLGVIPKPPGTCDWSPYVMNLSYFREFIDDVVRHEPPEFECINLKRPA